MTDTSHDQPKPNTSEPPPSLLTPSPQTAGGAARQQLKALLWFFLGIGPGILPLFLVQVIGSSNGCILSAIGLLAAGFLIANKPTRSLALGLVLGFLLAFAVSCSQEVDVINHKLT